MTKRSGKSGSGRDSIKRKQLRSGAGVPKNRSDKAQEAETKRKIAAAELSKDLPDATIVPDTDDLYFSYR
jgi:hypothetical protein